MPSLGFAGRCQEKPPRSHLYFGVRHSASLVPALGCAPRQRLLSARYERIRTATPRGRGPPGAGRGAAANCRHRGAGQPLSAACVRRMRPCSEGCAAPTQTPGAPSQPGESIEGMRTGESDFLSSSAKLIASGKKGRVKFGTFTCATLVKGGWLFCVPRETHLSSPRTRGAPGWSHRERLRGRRALPPTAERAKNCTEQLAGNSYLSFSSDMCQMV